MNARVIVLLLLYIHFWSFYVAGIWLFSSVFYLLPDYKVEDGSSIARRDVEL